MTDFKNRPTVNTKHLIVGENGTRSIYVGGSEPSAGTGVNGDIWIPDTGESIDDLAFGNVDGGNPTSDYGQVITLDGGTP